MSSRSAAALKSSGRLGVSIVVALMALFGQTPASADAPDFWVDGRFYVNSPSDLESTRAELGASFRDVLPWGSRVELHYGFGTMDATTLDSMVMDWRFRGKVEGTAVAPYTWTAWVDRPLYDPSQAERVVYFQFIWKVLLPNGSHYYLRGTTSRLGFYESPMPDPGSVQTIGRNNAQYQRLGLYVVLRD